MTTGEVHHLQPAPPQFPTGANGGIGFGNLTRHRIADLERRMEAVETDIRKISDTCIEIRTLAKPPMWIALADLLLLPRPLRTQCCGILRSKRGAAAESVAQVPRTRACRGERSHASQVGEGEMSGRGTCDDQCSGLRRCCAVLHAAQRSEPEAMTGHKRFLSYRVHNRLQFVISIVAQRGLQLLEVPAVDPKDVFGDYIPK